jgi:hypothetical protein
MNARLLFAVIVATCLGASSPARAHSLDEGTARITLRDEHVEVTAEWDIFLLVDRSPTDVATARAETLNETHARLWRVIEEGTTLRADGARVALELTGGPSPQEFRALAATLSASGREHGERVRLRLESRVPVRNARRVTLSVPPALGPVVVTFVQPASWYTRPGATASFDVLAPVRASASVTAPLPAKRPESSSRDVWLGLALTFAGAVGLVVKRRRDA